MMLVAMESVIAELIGAGAIDAFCVRSIPPLSSAIAIEGLIVDPDG